VSTAVEDMKAAKKAVVTEEAGFVIPALPGHVAAGSSSVTTTLVSLRAGPPGPPKLPAGSSNTKQKSNFPDTYLPVLLSKIESLATGSLITIVETVYQELKVHKVKKNAIESKVREIGEKCKEKKVWVVRTEVKVSG
jgi:chromatin assembly factor 1 subunit A